MCTFREITWDVRQLLVPNEKQGWRAESLVRIAYFMALSCHVPACVLKTTHRSLGTPRMHCRNLTADAITLKHDRPFCESLKAIQSFY